VPRDDFGKRGFSAVFDVFAEELSVGLCLHLTYLITIRGKIRQRFAELVVKS
jgi:hypothetical protein